MVRWLVGWSVRWMAPGGARATNIGCSLLSVEGSRSRTFAAIVERTAVLAFL